jgi:hypothetical protein
MHFAEFMASFELSCENRRLAHDFWHALYHAPTQNELEAARFDFSKAPDEVRSAVLQAYIDMLHARADPLTYENPFE